MIVVQDNVGVGDLVYFWSSPYKEKSKSTHEIECKVKFNSKDRLTLHSITGDYDVSYDKFLLETWNGNCRRV